MPSPAAPPGAAPETVARLRRLLYQRSQLCTQTRSPAPGKDGAAEAGNSHAASVATDAFLAEVATGAAAELEAGARNEALERAANADSEDYAERFMIARNRPENDKNYDKDGEWVGRASMSKRHRSEEFFSNTLEP